MEERDQGAHDTHLCIQHVMIMIIIIIMAADSSRFNSKLLN
jgi:hypothetical protein